MTATDDRRKRQASRTPAGSRAATQARPLAPIADAVRVASEPADLDAVDLNLLKLLATDSRMSQRSLARELHMSPPAIGDRIARLERLGVIRGYTVDVDWAALGYPMQVFMSVTAASDQAEILRALHALPEVEEISVVTGSFDLLARLRVRDHGHLRKLLIEYVWQIAGVSRTETMICLAESPLKDFTLGIVEQRGLEG